MSETRSFWARRRAGVAAEAEAEQALVEAEAVEREQAVFEDMEEAEVLAALDLPDPDTLTKGDDFTGFMAKAVPETIRRRALRALWRSNPVLANVDMLVDYGEDFTDSAMAVENIQTAYQVGKGMLKHIEEMARQAEALANPEVVEESDEEEEIVEEEVMVEAETPQPEPTVIVMAEDDQEEIIHTPTPRRMKFRLEGAA